MYSAEIYKN